MCLGIPVKIKKIHGDTALGDAGGVEREINVQLISGLNKGDYVLLHAGFAIQKIDAEEAEETLRLIREMGK